MLSMIPGIKLQGPMVVTPLVNIVLLARDLLEPRFQRRPGDRRVGGPVDGPVRGGGDRSRGPNFWDRRRFYGSHGTWSDLFRRPDASSAAPTPTSGLLCLAMIFPTYFLASNLLARSTLVSDRRAADPGRARDVLVFLQIPLAAAVLNRVDLA